MTIMPRHDEIEACWAAFRATGAVDHDRYDVWWFGDTPEMATRLAALVVHGPKRATAGLARDVDLGGAPAPAEGGWSVVLDGDGRPACILRSSQVERKPFREVDAAFAWDEGEGDRTLPDWIDGHRRYFTRQGEAEGFTFTEDLEVYFERFELHWGRSEG